MKINLLCALSVLSIAACGGGGSDPTPAAPAAPAAQPAPPTVTATGLIVIGNSITYVPETPPDWPHSNGMAASAPEKDFAHLTAAGLGLPAPEVHNFADLERIAPGSAERIPALTANVTPRTIVVIELGDNLQPENFPNFPSPYGQLLDAVQGALKLACVSTWWTDPVKDAMIKTACEAHGGVFVFIGDVQAMRLDPVDVYSNPGIDHHPQDPGHAMIAKRVLAALR